MRNCVASIALLFICVVAKSQTEPDIYLRLLNNQPGAGNVEIVQDAGVADLVKSHIESNKTYPVIDGYRIQLYSGSGGNARKEAEETKAKAMVHFPGQQVYLTWNAPFWRVRVGNFRNKSESLLLREKLKVIFPNCYPVKESGIRIADLDAKEGL